MVKFSYQQQKDILDSLCKHLFWNQKQTSSKKPRPLQQQHLKFNFTGKEAVDFVLNKKGLSRAQATKLLEQCRKSGFISSRIIQTKFTDSNILYFNVVPADLLDIVNDFDEELQYIDSLEHESYEFRMREIRKRYNYLAKIIRALYTFSGNKATTPSTTPPMLSPSSRGSGKVVEAEVLLPKTKPDDSLAFAADSPSRGRLKKVRSSKSVIREDSMSDSSPRDGIAGLERKNSRKFSPRMAVSDLPSYGERRHSARTLKLERRNSSNSYLTGKKISADDFPAQQNSAKVSFIDEMQEGLEVSTVVSGKRAFPKKDVSRDVSMSDSSVTGEITPLSSSADTPMNPLNQSDDAHETTSQEAKPSSSPPSTPPQANAKDEKDKPGHQTSAPKDLKLPLTLMKPATSEQAEPVLSRVKHSDSSSEPDATAGLTAPSKSRFNWNSRSKSIKEPAPTAGSAATSSSSIVTAKLKRLSNQLLQTSTPEKVSNSSHASSTFNTAIANLSGSSASGLSTGNQQAHMENSGDSPLQSPLSTSSSAIPKSGSRENFDGSDSNQPDGKESSDGSSTHEKVIWKLGLASSSTSSENDETDFYNCTIQMRLKDPREPKPFTCFADETWLFLPHDITSARYQLIPEDVRKQFHQDYTLLSESEHFDVSGYRIDYYADLFKEEVYFPCIEHSNWLGKRLGEKAEANFLSSRVDYLIVTIYETFEAYVLLVNSKYGYSRHFIKEKSHIEKDGKQSYSLVESYLNHHSAEFARSGKVREPGKKEKVKEQDSYSFKRIEKDSEKFMLDLMGIEERFSLNQSSFSVGFTYAKNGQCKPMEFFENKHTGLSEAATDFFFNMKIFRGKRDVRDPENEAQSAVSWFGHDVRLDCSVLMSNEDIRSYIGNDVALVIFVDEGEPFNPVYSNEFGNVTQVFIVVQPQDGCYRVGVYSKGGIAFRPNYCRAPLSPEDIFDYILTLAHNGIMKSFSMPPLSKLIEVPRARAMQAVVERFGDPASVKQKSGKSSHSSKVRKQRSHSSSMFH